jgi:NADH:ubiquinone oxidoreductase subunit 2 (subunit N)
MILVVIFVGLNSVLSLGYYAPIVNRLYRREISPAVENGKPIPVMMVIPLVILVLALVVIGLWPASMDFFTEKATSSLLFPFFY